MFAPIADVMGDMATRASGWAAPVLVAGAIIGVAVVVYVYVRVKRGRGLK